MARVRLLAPRDIPTEDRSSSGAWTPKGALINLYRAMAHSPVALRRLYELLSCLWGGALSDRLREIAILSVVSASNAPYPLGWHLLDAKEAGLTPSEIQAVCSGDAAQVLPAGEAAVALFAGSLALHANVDTGTFQAVADHMDEQQIVELTMIVGVYRLVACFANGLAVDLDDQPARALEQFRMEKPLP